MMTPEQLTFAREWVEGFAYGLDSPNCVPVRLLAEVDRLRAQVAAVETYVLNVQTPVTIWEICDKIVEILEIET